MGLESKAKVTLKRKSFEAEVQVESDHILVRGSEQRIKILTADLKSVETKGDSLVLDFDGGPLTIDLGGDARAKKWRTKILNPPSRMDKLGLKPGMTFWAQGAFDAEFQRHLDPARANTPQLADMLFVEVASQAELDQAAAIGQAMNAQAAIWIVFPKGKQSPFKDNAVFATMRAAGLTDNKVCSFNESLTALRFVVPKSKR